MIKCPHCSKEYNENDKACPYCGHPRSTYSFWGGKDRYCFHCFKKYNESLPECPYCGSETSADPIEPIQLKPGTKLYDRYIIGHAIGQGGFGIVYRAWDTKLETAIAIKEHFISRLVTRAPGTGKLIVSQKSHDEFEYRKRRFLAEARAMAKFGAHRCIPNVYEYFEENNTAYIVMELLDGMTLSEYMKLHGNKVNLNFAVFIANEVGSALKSMHTAGIIHRDVAPDNIYITNDKDIRVILMDLGAARLPDKEENDVIDIVCKPGYSPVEQYTMDNNKGRDAADRDLGPWSDIYALGATLYYMVTGIKPDESTNRRIEDNVVAPHDLNPQIPEYLSNAIMKALAIDAYMRFKSVDDYLKAINGEKKVASLHHERKKRMLTRSIGIAIACIVLCLAGLLAYRMFDKKKKESGLTPAKISIWYYLDENNPQKEAAMGAVKEQFIETFPEIETELRGIPADEYDNELLKAKESDKMPTIFESTGRNEEITAYGSDLDNVIASDEFKEALFLEQYSSYYDTKKALPLAIEVPVACVITGGNNSIEYDSEFFKSTDDFGEGVNIAVEKGSFALIKKNFSGDFFSQGLFFGETNECPILLTSTMGIGKTRANARETGFACKYVYPDCDNIYCRFICEWSIGGGTGDEIAAAEQFLKCMLTDRYQTILFKQYSSDMSIPVNPNAFKSKISVIPEMRNIENIYDKFVFEKWKEIKE